MTCFDNHSGYHASTFPPHTIAEVARASTGEGTNPAAAAEQAEFRTLARTWLRGDMEKHKAFMTQSTPAQLGVRDAAALAKLPADEQKALTQLCQRLSKGISR